MLPKHRGLTGFVVDMHAPGVEVRPLRQMTGGASFNEVFFTDVRIPDSHRLGDVNGGWTVALTTLMNERAAIGGGGGGVGLPTTTRLIEMVRALGAGRRPADPPAAGRRHHQRAGGPLHQPPGHGQDRRRPAARAGDVAGQAVADRQHGAHLRAGVVGSRARRSSPTPAPGAPTPGRSSSSGSPACGSPAGTDEVLRNILGERVLGLPKEPPVR